MKKDLSVLIYIYSTRIYSAIMTVALIPAIIKKIGIEQYGLIGFYIVLQACLSILDAGVGGVLTRQAIISSSDKKSYESFIGIYKKIIFVFMIISIAIVLIGISIPDTVISGWLRSDINKNQIAWCFTLMLVIFSVRYIQSPFRSILLASESQISLSTISLVGVTISQPVALAALSFFRPDVEVYFIVQLLSALVTTIAIIVLGEQKRKRILKRLPSTHNNSSNHIASVRQLLFFALQLSALSILWIIVNQSDKLALTRFLTLSDYAKYSVAVSIASVLIIVTDPLNQFLQPRLTRYVHEQEREKYSNLLMRAFLFLSAVTIPLCSFIVFYSKDIVYIWSGDAALSKEVSRYLPWLFFGGVCSIFSNLCFLILYSFGKLKMHTFVYVVFSVIIIPGNILVASKYQGDGSSLWYGMSALLLFIFWGGYNLHKYFERGLSLILNYMIPSFLISALFFNIANKFLTVTDNRLSLFLCISLIGLTGFLLTLASLFMIARHSKPILLKRI